MINIYLARHGQSLDNYNGILNGHRDKPLTKKGVEQATEVANMIKNAKLSFDYVYSSPLKRALVTAEIISEISENPKPITLPLLIERDFGDMTGVKLSRIEELCSPEIIKTERIVYFLSPKNAETFPQLLLRAKKLLEFINKKHKKGSILLLTHGDFGKMIYAAYYNLDWKKTLTMFEFGNSDLLLLSKDSKPNKTHVFKIAQYNS